MSVSTPWSSATPASVTRLNKTSVISDTGANLAGYTISAFKIITCTATGSGFTENHVYIGAEDGNSWIDLSTPPDHTHTEEGNGGPLIYLYTNGPEVLDLQLTRPTDLIKANWNQTVTGTGTIEDGGGGASSQYIRLRPNGTSGSGSTISYTNALNVGFINPSVFSCAGNFETASSLAFHAGVNCDDVTAADSNTRKYQAEVCTATNNNWWLRTATGSANSSSDIGVAIVNSDVSIKLVHDPWVGTPKVVMEIEAANTFTKTTNIPVDGSSTIGNMLKFSIKNNTGADRPYRMKGCRISYQTDDTWAYGPT